MKLFVMHDMVYGEDSVRSSEFFQNEVAEIFLLHSIGYDLSFRNGMTVFTLYRQDVSLNERDMSELFRRVFLRLFDMGRFRYFCGDKNEFSICCE